MTAGAGVAWDDLVVWTIEHELFGLECLSGVPGTVGGASGRKSRRVRRADERSPSYTLKCMIRDQTRMEKIVKKKRVIFHTTTACSVARREISRTARGVLAFKDASAQLSYRDNRFDMTTLAAKVRSSADADGYPTGGTRHARRERLAHYGESPFV